MFKTGFNKLFNLKNVLGLAVIINLLVNPLSASYAQGFNSLTSLIPGLGGSNTVGYTNGVPTGLTSPGNTSSMPGFNLTPGAIYQQLNGLPPTTLDSFVFSSGANMEQIYGDEGTGVFSQSGLAPTPGLVTNSPLAPTPIEGFAAQNRIGWGIASSTSNLGLTTGHNSYMPSAWGADEFLIPGGEWANSGTGGVSGMFGSLSNIVGGAALFGMP